MTPLEQIKIELNRAKNKAGLVSGSLTVKEYDDLEQNVMACIYPESWNIDIKLRKDFEPIKDKRQQAYARVKKIKNGKHTMLEDLLAHELAHWELPFSSGLGCPYDTYNHDLILEAVKNALPADKKGQAKYVANAFEDLMINPRVREYREEFNGMVLFWDDQGNLCKEKGAKHYTPFYEAFVKLNMHLFGDNIDKALLKRHYSKSKKVNSAVQKTIQELNLSENIQDTSILFVKQNWPRMAEIFARNLAELLDKQPTERLSAYSPNGSSKENQKPGNGVEQKVGTREGKEEIAYGRYKSNKPLSSNLTSYEQLDGLYRSLARAIPVNVEAMTREFSMPLSPLNFRSYDEETDDFRKVKASKLFLDNGGKLTFGYPKEQIVIQAKSKVQRRSFPDFKIVLLDNSGSMASGLNGSQGNTITIPWGDNSKYHYALLGFYGIENFLQSQGIAQYIGHGMSLFSNSTRYKEGNFNDLTELRKLALSPEFGTTHLDAGYLVRALNGRESFVLSLSDGEIMNWEQSRQKFFELAKNNYFAHIQLGGRNEFTSELEQANIPVFYVDSGDKLSKLMVNITQDTYKEFMRR